MKQCIDAFKNLNIINDTGLSISPCCVSQVHKVSNIDFFNDPTLSRIRNTWRNNHFPKECVTCERSEQVQNSSRRTDSNQWYIDNGIYNTELELIRLDYWVGDICNLACAICGPKDSSQWKKELDFPVSQRKMIVNKLWNTLDLTKLKFIHFNGGEPLLSKEHVEFLNAIPNKHLVHLNYNTNGTILPTNFLLELWGQFKLVQLDFSIDDLGPRYEYQRYPATWETIEHNLQWFVDNSPSNCMFAVNTTVSVLNQANIHKLDAWLLENFYSNRFTDLVNYRKQAAFGKLSTSNIQQRSTQIVTYLNSLDQRRGTSWKETFPELIELLILNK